MKKFNVHVRTSGGDHFFEGAGNTSAEVHEEAADRFGNLCAVLVTPK
jgi:hypothetical protein